MEDIKLTDKEIEYYHGSITIKSIFDDKDGKFFWMVCCKKCGGHLFPHFTDMPKERVDQALKEHKCIKITGLNKKKNGK